MGKTNRGNTTKLSMRLSSAARKVHEDGTVTGVIPDAAANLGISQANVVLFELTKLLQNPPSKQHIEKLESEITLERKHFVVTVNETLMNKINTLSEEYDIKKNVLIGYIVSEHFEKMSPRQREDVEPKKLMVQVNEHLKKKMDEYTETHYIPLNALVSYSILQGPYDGMPQYEAGESIQFFTNVPGYIGELVKSKAEEGNIREHFYTSLCLYKQFMTPGGRFFE